MDGCLWNAREDVEVELVVNLAGFVAAVEAGEDEATARAGAVNGGVKVRRVADPKCYTRPAILPSARALSNLLDRC